MHEFCGWIADAPTTMSQVHNGLVEMLAVSAGSPKETQDWLTTRGGFLVSKEGDVWAIEEDGLMVMIAGRPQLPQGQASPNPAQAVLRLWQRHGQEVLGEMHGPFALAVCDSRARTTLLAVDRMGIQPLAFALGRGGVAFSSRADRVAAHPAVAAKLSAQGIFNYIYFSVIPAPNTLFTDVEKLLPGQWVRIRAGTIDRGFYWRLRYRDQPRRDFDDQAARFKGILREAVARAKGDDEAAAFLSGGTDSSTIAGILTEIQGKPARTYSIGFAAEGFDEMEYARIAARHFGLDAREYYLTPDDVLTAMPLIAAHYDQPFANESAVSAYFCAKLAADDGYRVILGGDGGDEIFGGNERYAKQRIFEYYSLLPATLRQRLIEPLADWPGLDATALTRKARSYVRQARIPLPGRMETYNFIYRQPLAEMFEADFLAQIDPGMPDRLLKDPYERAATQHYLNRMLHLDLKLTLADNDLPKVSVMAEAAGIAVRYPLIDDAMVEFSGQVPPDWKVKGHSLRWFFKRALTGYLPDEIINKSKHGFGLPFGLWLRDHPPLREYVGDRLADFRRRGWLKPSYIDRIQADHKTQHASYFGKMLWVMATLEEWLRSRPDGNA